MLGLKVIGSKVKVANNIKNTLRRRQTDGRFALEDHLEFN